MQGRVYALYDPRDPEKLRYIGQTRHAITERRNSHVYRATHQNLNLYCDNWIRGLLRDGVTPGVRLLVEEDLTSKELDNFEITYISRYKMLGHRLTNMTAGGMGFSGLRKKTRRR